MTPSEDKAICTELEEDFEATDDEEEDEAAAAEEEEAVDAAASAFFVTWLGATDDAEAVVSESKRAFISVFSIKECSSSRNFSSCDWESPKRFL